MRIKHEIHVKGKAELWSPSYTTGCECSYCKGDSKLHFGLNIPANKSKTSWYVVKYWDYHYLRFTLPKFMLGGRNEAVKNK